MRIVSNSYILGTKCSF